MRVLEAVVSRERKWGMPQYGSISAFASVKVEVEKGDDVATILQDLQRLVDSHVAAQNPQQAENLVVATGAQRSPIETPPPKPAAPAPAPPEQIRVAQDKAQTTIDGAPKTPPPAGGRPTFPTGPTPAGRARLLLHLATSRFHEALRGAGFQPLGAGWWWADLTPDALQTRVEWAAMNRVPYAHANGRSLPPGVPAPPEVPL